MRIFASFFPLSIGFAVIAFAQTPLPPGGLNLLSQDAPASFGLSNSPGDDAATDRFIDVTGASFARARRIETRRDSSPPWAIELHGVFTKSARENDVALVHFFARSATAADESGRARIRIAVQNASGEHEKDFQSEVSVGQKWQEFFLPFTFSHPHETGTAEIVFGFGYKRQVVDLSVVELLNYGSKVPIATLPKTRFSYAGREPDASWRRAALDRIEQLRKDDVTLQVVDAAGSPIAGATVHITERRSHFQWGSALQFARLVNDSPDNQIYRSKALELFNAASPENDLKWPVWEGDWGAGYGHEQSLAALRWLNEKHFYVRGHVLVWPGWKDLPNSITTRRDTPQQAEIPAMILAHIRDETRATAGLIREWDVLNEPYDHHDLMDIFGTDIMTSWFKTAAESVPGVPLFINDYSNHDMITDSDHFKNFYHNIELLRKSSAPLGGIGLQGHIGSQPNAPENVLATIDALAEFNLPIRITEFDVDTDDEELQADYTRDFLTLAFSHASVVGVQHWGFWEKSHWRPRAAMFRTDWSEKPNARRYRDLVLHQWRTETSGQSNAEGKYSVRGFHGDYEVVVEKNGHRVQQEFALRPGQAVSFTVTLPSP